MVRTYEDAKASQFKSQIRSDELIIKPCNGHPKETVDLAKNRIRARNQEKRQTSYLINKSMDQLEGSKLTRFQFRVKHFTSYLSSQVSRVKDAAGHICGCAGINVDDLLLKKVAFFGLNLMDMG